MTFEEWYADPSIQFASAQAGLEGAWKAGQQVVVDRIRHIMDGEEPLPGYISDKLAAIEKELASLPNTDDLAAAVERGAKDHADGVSFDTNHTNEFWAAGWNAADHGSVHSPNRKLEGMCDSMRVGVKRFLHGEALPEHAIKEVQLGWQLAQQVAEATKVSIKTAMGKATLATLQLWNKVVESVS